MKQAFFKRQNSIGFWVYYAFIEQENKTTKIIEVYGNSIEANDGDDFYGTIAWQIDYYKNQEEELVEISELEFTKNYEQTLNLIIL